MLIKFLIKDTEYCNFKGLYITYMDIVMGIGGHYCGRLGLDLDNPIPTTDKPQQIKAPKTKQISCGQYCTAIIDIDDKFGLLNDNIPYMC